MTPQEAVELAGRIAEGRHDGDRSTYFSAMLVLSRALLSLHAECEAMRGENEIVKAALAWKANEDEIDALIDADMTMISMKHRKREWQTLDALRTAIDAFRARKP